jgi:hypothetical protein
MKIAIIMLVFAAQDVKGSTTSYSYTGNPFSSVRVRG